MEDPALLEPPLLLEPHDLEAVEVGEVLPALDLLPALEPVRLLPLRVDLVLLPELLDGAVAGAAGEALDLHVGDEALGQADGLAGDLSVGGRAIDKDLDIFRVNQNCSRKFPSIL